MTGKEFALAHYGEQWLIKQSGQDLRVIVRGYFAGHIHDNLVVVEPCIGYRAAGPIMHWEVVLVPSQIVVKCDNKDNLHYYADLSCFIHRIAASAPIVMPYPHRCGICKAPARKSKEQVFCSNTRCKSWRKVRMRSNAR